MSGMSALMVRQKTQSGGIEKQLQELCSLASFFNGKANFMVINIRVCVGQELSPASLTHPACVYLLLQRTS